MKEEKRMKRKIIRLIGLLGFIFLLLSSLLPTFPGGDPRIVRAEEPAGEGGLISELKMTGSAFICMMTTGN